MTIELPNVEGLTVDDAKHTLRSAVWGARRKRSQESNDRLELQWVHTALDFIGDARTVAAYYSTPAEPPTHKIIDTIIGEGKRLLLPVVGPHLARNWAWYTGPECLEQKAPSRPLEPKGEPYDSTILREVDAILVPATLIDHHGHRLGQGGGWYDRALLHLEPGTRIGAMVYPEEYVTIDLPQDQHDQHIPYVVLPDRWGETS